MKLSLRSVRLNMPSKVLLTVGALSCISIAGAGTGRRVVAPVGLSGIAEANADTPMAGGAPQQTAGRSVVASDDVGGGTLMFRSHQDGARIEAPLLATDVSIDVTGPIARTKLTQRFENPSDGWVEGTYVFPLPESGAVDSLRVRVGDRFIEGEVKERAEARRVYEEAKAAGAKAGLVEQHRPNMFETSVANVGPREIIIVQIEYEETVRFDAGTFSLRVPIVVGPRYNPGGDNSASAAPASPVMVPALLTGVNLAATRMNPVRLHVNLEAGFALGSVQSATHAARVSKHGRSSATVDLPEGTSADRDMELRWTAAPSSTPTASLFREHIGQDDYVLAYVIPPSAPASDAKPCARESVFVIDNSGSMGGESMRQAKAALVLALSKLRSGDTFNVVRFDDTFDTLFPDSVPASTANIDKAKRYAESLEARGGTEMLPALKASLMDTTHGARNDVRQVIFLTDGAVGNEDAMFEEIGLHLGRTRLFPVGIGSAPNSFFMARAARLGRGAFTHISDVATVEQRMRALLTKIESPLMTQVEAQLPGAEVWPARLPDVFAGEPVVLTAKLSAEHAKLTVSGRLSEAAWHESLDPDGAAAGKGIGKLWARRKIEALEDTRYEGQSQETVDKRVLATALQFHLVSRLTSLVALDKTPSRPKDAPLATQQVPLMLPAGWDFEKVFGVLPSRAAGAGVAVQGLSIAHTPPGSAPSAAGGNDDSDLDLPGAATPMGLLALQSACLCALGAALFAVRRRMQRALGGA